MAGCDVVADAARLRSLIGLTGQFAAVDELLTGRENLELVGLFYQLSKAERRRRAQDVLERFTLTDAADQLVKTYSGGMRRRLDVGASLIGRPRVLFLDEPTTGLDPRTRNDVWSFVEELVAGGTTVLLTTQYMEEAEHLAHRIVVMDAGVEVAQGTAAELKDRLGGDVLEARVSSASDLDRAAALIADLGQGVPRVDGDQRTVSMPTKGATQVLIAAGQRLQGDGIALEDLGIRHPSLDDVFLSLTGNAAPIRANGAHPNGRSPDVPAVASTQQPDTRRTDATRATADGGRRARYRGCRQAQPPAHPRNPRLLVFSAVQPAMLLVLFRYVLGGAIHIPGGSYVDYIVPAVFIEAVMIGGMATAIGLADDLGSGIIDRFRSLPMARSAVLAGRTLADLSRSVFALALMVALGLLVGFSFHAERRRDHRRAGAGARLRLLLLLDLRHHRPAHEGPRNRPGRRHPAVLRPRVRQLGDRPRRHDARLASALRTPPAREHHDQRRARAAAGRTDAPLGVAVTRLVSRDSPRVLHDRGASVPQRHRLKGLRSHLRGMVPGWTPGWSLDRGEPECAP